MRSNVRRAARQLVRLIPTHWDLQVFLDRLAAARQRPIVIVDWDFAAEGGISGAWKPTDKRDLVFVSSSAIGDFRTAIICHELGHMLLNHRPDELGLTGDDAVELLMPLLSSEATPELVSKFVLYRHDYESQAEVDAEYLASVVMAEINVPQPQGDASQVANSFQW